MKRTFLGAVVAIILAMSVAVTAGPGRPTQTGATINLNIPNTPTATTGWPALGDSVTFNVTYAKQLDKFGVRIQVLCYQDGNLVYGEAGPYNQAFQLGGAMSVWLQGGGPADCVADLFYWSYNGGQKFNWLASTNFAAADKI